jgi:hypothetical protein
MRLEPLVEKIKIQLLQKFEIRKFTNSQQSRNKKKFIRKTCPGHKFFRLSMDDTRKLVGNCRVFMGILNSTILWKKNREAKLNFQRKVLKRIQAFSVSKFEQNNNNNNGLFIDLKTQIGYQRSLLLKFTK